MLSKTFQNIFLLMAIPFFFQRVFAHQPANKTHGTVFLKSFFSKSLGIEKYYNVYLPADYEMSKERYPVVFFMRGHEREWFNPTEDGSRNGRALQHIADDLIASGKIGKMILVGISTASSDNQIPCLGVNMLFAKESSSSGVGTGKFEEYLTNDLIEHIDSTYRTLANRENRGIDGFSLGGYTSVMIGVKHSHLFSSVGSYDGTHMWFDFDDLRRNDASPDDYTWVKTDFFKYAFGEKRNIDYMKRYNPLNLLMIASEEELQRIRSIRFHILSAAYDGDKGNIERAEHLLNFFEKKKIKNSFSCVKLTPNALHDWHHANLYAEKVLAKHWQTFSNR